VLHAPRATHRRRRGLTLIEVLIAVVVLVAALTAFIRSLTGTVQLGRANRESSLAMEGARRTIEELYAADFAQVFALYNSRTDDDPVPDAPGASFAVATLEAQEGDADGFVGEIRFPTVGAGPLLELREDIADDALGMPRDLDGANGIDAFEHSVDYRYLPVEVRVRWKGRSGEKELTLKTVLVDK